MRTASLDGALLDYWIGRANGITPDRLRLRDGVMTERCCEVWGVKPSMWGAYSPSSSLDMLLSMQSKVFIDVMWGGTTKVWYASPATGQYRNQMVSDANLFKALARGIVLNTFGPEVDDV